MIVLNKAQNPNLELISIFFRESGLRGLFRGVDSKLLQSVLAAGFMFLAYEKVP